MVTEGCDCDCGWGWGCDCDCDCDCEAPFMMVTRDTAGSLGEGGAAKFALLWGEGGFVGLWTVWCWPGVGIIIDHGHQLTARGAWATIWNIFRRTGVLPPVSRTRPLYLARSTLRNWNALPSALAHSRSCRAAPRRAFAGRCCRDAEHGRRDHPRSQHPISTSTMEMDDEIAAAMGFGAFGSSTKKRRIEEAFTEFNYADFNPSASGTNTTPLGPRRKSSDSGTDAAVAAGSAEKVASPAGESANSTPLDSILANQNAESEAAKTPDPTEGMKAGDARKLKKRKAKKEVPSGLAGFLNRGHQLPDRPTNEPPSIPADSTPAVASTTVPADSTTVVASTAGSTLATVSVAPPADSTLAAASTGPPTDSTRAAVPLTPEPGEILEPGIAYFRPSFIEDPWSNLPAPPA